MQDPREELWEHTVVNESVECTSLKFAQQLKYLQHSNFYLPPEGLSSLRTKLNLSQVGYLMVQMATGRRVTPVVPVELALLWWERYQAAEGGIIWMKQKSRALNILKFPQQFLYYQNNLAKPLGNFFHLNSILPLQGVKMSIRNGKLEALKHSEKNFDQCLG